MGTCNGDQVVETRPAELADVALLPDQLCGDDGEVGEWELHFQFPLC